MWLPIPGHLVHYLSGSALLLGPPLCSYDATLSLSGHETGVDEKGISIKLVPTGMRRRQKGWGAREFRTGTGQGDDRNTQAEDT